jgi:hypothetical protein
MSNDNPDCNPVETSSTSGSSATSAGGGAGLEAPGLPRLMVIALLAGLVAGVASWRVGEAAVTRFVPSLNVDRKQFNTIEKVTYERLRLVIRAITNRAMVSYGACGAALGLALGLAGGLARRSATRGLLAAILGLILGGAAGAVGTSQLLPVYFEAVRTSEDHLSSNITVPLLIHGGIWTAVGLAAGLALGMGLGGWGRAVQAGIGGALGAVFGTFLYEFTGPFAFPKAATAEPLATERFARLAAHLSVAVLVALGAAWSARSLSAKPTTEATLVD